MKKKKIILIIIVLIAILCLSLAYFNKSELKKETKSKKEEDILSSKIYKNLKFTSISLYAENELTHISMNVTNNGNEDFKSDSVKLSFYDNDNKKLYDKIVVLPDIEKGKTVTVDLIVDTDALGAKNFKILSN